MMLTTRAQLSEFFMFELLHVEKLVCMLDLGTRVSKEKTKYPKNSPFNFALFFTESVYSIHTPACLSLGGHFQIKHTYKRSQILCFWNSLTYLCHNYSEAFVEFKDF